MEGACEEGSKVTLGSAVRGFSQVPVLRFRAAPLQGRAGNQLQDQLGLPKPAPASLVPRWGQENSVPGPAPTRGGVGGGLRTARSRGPTKDPAEAHTASGPQQPRHTPPHLILGLAESPHRDRGFRGAGSKQRQHSGGGAGTGRHLLPLLPMAPYLATGSSPVSFPVSLGSPSLPRAWCLGAGVKFHESLFSGPWWGGAAWSSGHPPTQSPRGSACPETQAQGQAAWWPGYPPCLWPGLPCTPIPPRTGGSPLTSWTLLPADRGTDKVRAKVGMLVPLGACLLEPVPRQGLQLPRVSE